MTKIPKYWNKAKKYLAKKDKVMFKLIENYKSPSEIILTSRQDIFFSLCKSIIGQQISISAANSVFLKFKKKCNNKINAKTVSKLSFNQLKSCGFSRQKVLGIKSLAKKIINKSFNPKLIKKMDDEEAIEYLSELKQIDSKAIKEVRGKGLWIGMELNKSYINAKDLCLMLLNEGLLCKETHKTVIRFAPPLMISKEDLDWAINKITKVIKAI